MKKKVSLKDIAQKVGVSTALVSYVLNNQKVDRISKAVAQKIKDTAKELNYRANQVARSLKTNKTNIIGLIVADISNSFSSTLARIIEDEAEKHNYTVIFGSSDENAERSQKLQDVLLNHQVDGLIIAPAEHSQSQIEYLLENEVPVVMIDRHFPGLEASYIVIDNYKASFELVEHLLKNGRKRIGIISYDTTLVNLLDRKRGYAKCLEDHDLTVDPNKIKEVGLIFTKDQVEKAVNELLSLPEPVDAILFASNTLSVLGLKYLNTLDLKIPEDLAIVAFDESDAADLFYAPLTHTRQPLKEMGKLATKTLIASIEKDDTLVQVRMNAELIIRKSSG
jgi:LacI family transcriptional regulator